MWTLKRFSLGGRRGGRSVTGSLVTRAVRGGGGRLQGAGKDFRIGFRNDQSQMSPVSIYIYKEGNANDGQMTPFCVCA